MADLLRYEEHVSRLTDLCKELSDSASSFNSKTTSQEQSLRQKALSIDSSLHNLCSSIVSSVATGNLDRVNGDKLDEELYKARCLLRDGDASTFLPVKSQGRFLKMFLGPVNVRASRKDVQLKVKEEYNII